MIMINECIYEQPERLEDRQASKEGSNSNNTAFKIWLNLFAIKHMFQNLSNQQQLFPLLNAKTSVRCYYKAPHKKYVSEPLLLQQKQLLEVFP